MRRWLLRRWIAAGLAACCGAVLIACARLPISPSSSTHPLHRSSKRARLSAIRRAQVWRPTVIPSMDIVAGPPDKKGFARHSTVSCTYVHHKARGHSPKFTCEIAPGDEFSDAQLHDLFEVARFPLRSQGVKPDKPMITTDQWVDAFKEKRDEIVHRSCV